jgi:DNA-binding transcriptional ArsR family regulator
MVAGMHEQLPDFDMPDSEQVDLAAETFRLLADPTRIKILWALLQGESSVACLADLAGTSPTAVSQHLAKLRMSRLVTARRQGTFMYYSAADDHVRKLLGQALHHADHIDPADREDTAGAPVKAAATKV